MFMVSKVLKSLKIRPRGYKTFFMLNPTEHEISVVHNNLNTNKRRSALLVVFIMLINVKMPTIVGIQLIFMSRINFVTELSMKKSFMTSGPDLKVFKKSLFSVSTTKYHFSTAHNI